MGQSSGSNTVVGLAVDKALAGKPESAERASRRAAALLKSVKPAEAPVPDEELLAVDDLVDPAKIEQERARKKKRLDFSIGALSTIAQLEEARAEILSEDGWENDAELKARMEKLEGRIAAIRKAGGNHLGYSALTAEIGAAKTVAEARAIFARLESEPFTDRGNTRYSAPGGEWVQKWKSSNKGNMPEGSVFFDEHWHVPFQPDPGHEKTGGQKRLETLVVAMVGRVEKMRRSEGRRKAGEIRARTDIVDFPVERVRARENVPTGTYRLEIPEYERGGGLVVVEVKTRKLGNEEVAFFHFRDGTGCADCLVGKTYRGYRRKSGEGFDTDLALAIGQILAKEFKMPQTYSASEEGQRDIRYFARIMRSGVIALLRKTEEASAENGGETAPEPSEEGGADASQAAG